MGVSCPRNSLILSATLVTRQTMKEMRRWYPGCHNGNAYAKDIFGAVSPWISLHGVRPDRSSILGEFTWLAAGAEDSSRRDDLEETFRKLCERLRYSDLVPGDKWRTEYSEARRSQRETHGKQTPFPQRSHRGCNRRGRRSGDRRCINGPPGRHPYRCKSCQGRRSRGNSWSNRWRDPWSPVALSQHDLPSDSTLVCFGFF